MNTRNTRTINYHGAANIQFRMAIQKLLFKIIIRRSVEINKHQVVLIIPPSPPNPLDHQAVLLESGTASAIQNSDEGLEHLENNQKVNITNLIGQLRAS